MLQEKSKNAGGQQFYLSIETKFISTNTRISPDIAARFSKEYLPLKLDPVRIKYITFIQCIYVVKLKLKQRRALGFSNSMVQRSARRAFELPTHSH